MSADMRVREGCLPGGTERTLLYCLCDDTIVSLASVWQELTLRMVTYTRESVCHIPNVPTIMHTSNSECKAYTKMALTERSQKSEKE